MPNTPVNRLRSPCRFNGKLVAAYSLFPKVAHWRVSERAVRLNPRLLIELYAPRALPPCRAFTTVRQGHLCRPMTVVTDGIESIMAIGVTWRVRLICVRIPLVLWFHGEITQISGG
jgi:hypothetical protein